MLLGALKSLTDDTVRAVKGALIFIAYKEHPGSILKKLLNNQIKSDR